MKHDKEIIKLWDRGLTATEIGHQIGKTRSAVLGRISRLRASGVEIERRASAAKPPKTKRTKPRKVHPEQRVQYILPFDPEPIIEAVEPKPLVIDARSLVSLFDLKQNACHYIADRSDDGALYCAQPSYRRQMCRAHYDLCYIRLKTNATGRQQGRFFRLSLQP